MNILGKVLSDPMMPLNKKGVNFQVDYIPLPVILENRLYKNARGLYLFFDSSLGVFWYNGKSYKLSEGIFSRLRKEANRLLGHTDNSAFISYSKACEWQQKYGYDIVNNATACIINLPEIDRDTLEDAEDFLRDKLQPYINVQTAKKGTRFETLTLPENAV